MDAFIQILIIFVAFAGFLLTFYIGHKKSAHEKMICPLDSDCDAVIHSKYSKLFGIRLEYLGMIYYAVIALSYGVFIFYQNAAAITYETLLLLASVGAFMFSMYLIYIQGVKLKEWCTWCLVSALFSTVIFFSVLALL